MIAIYLALLFAGQEAAELEIPSRYDRTAKVSDAALVALVKTPFDPSDDRREWIRSIGTHRGIPVWATYVCSDVCPDYTKRIIRYNLPAGPECEAAGGVSKSLQVPMGIGVGQRRYCLPAVTAPYQN